MKNKFRSLILAAFISLTPAITMAQQNKIICNENTCKKGDRICKKAEFIKYHFVIAGKAQDLSGEFETIRKESNLSTKVDLLLKKLTSLSLMAKPDPGSFNMLKTVFKDQELDEKTKQNYKETLSTETTRLRNAVSSARRLLAQKDKLSKNEQAELEFSVNGLIESVIGRIKMVESEQIDTAENRFTACMYFDEAELSLGTAKDLAKASIVDMLIFGAVVNPLSDLARTGKYNMSLTRIEMLNSKHADPKKESAPNSKGHL